MLSPAKYAAKAAANSSYRASAVLHLKQEPPDATGRMVVVDRQAAARFAGPQADRARAVLAGQHRRVLRFADAASFNQLARDLGRGSLRTSTRPATRSYRTRRISRRVAGLLALKRAGSDSLAPAFDAEAGCRPAPVALHCSKEKG
jgi:hypothetical protein